LDVELYGRGFFRKYHRPNGILDDRFDRNRRPLEDKAGWSLGPGKSEEVFGKPTKPLTLPMEGVKRFSEVTVARDRCLKLAGQEIDVALDGGQRCAKLV